MHRRSQTSTLAPLLAAEAPVCPEGANSAVMQIHVGVFIQTYCSVSRRVPKQTMSAIKMSSITAVRGHSSGKRKTGRISAWRHLQWQKNLFVVIATIYIKLYLNTV